MLTRFVGEANCVVIMVFKLAETLDKAVFTLPDAETKVVATVVICVLSAPETLTIFTFHELDAASKPLLRLPETLTRL